jgi:stage IV sporulation protein FA
MGGTAVADHDRVKQRRQDRIRKLMEQRPDQITDEFPFPDDTYMHPNNARTRFTDQDDEPDPEKLWKSRENPWSESGWDTVLQGGGIHDRSLHDQALHERSVHDRNSRLKPDYPNRDRSGWSGLGKVLAVKFTISAFIFAGAWGMFALEEPWAKTGQSFVKRALSEDMDLAAVAAWYRDKFAGAPSFIPIFNPQQENAHNADGTVQLPVYAPVRGGTVVHPFAELLNGVEIAAPSKAKVSAVETGRVMLVTGDNTNGSVTVVMQHANRRVSVYGKLAEANVAVSDWIEAGRQIGTLPQAVGGGASLLYFAVKENGSYVDPADVIPLD